MRRFRGEGLSGVQDGSPDEADVPVCCSPRCRQIQAPPFFQEALLETKAGSIPDRGFLRQESPRYRGVHTRCVLWMGLFSGRRARLNAADSYAGICSGNPRLSNE